MPAIEINTVVETTSRHRVTVSGQEIVRLLKDSGVEIDDNATVTVQVPGGGDWSNMALDLDTETTVRIEWTTKDIKP